MSYDGVFIFLQNICIWWDFYGVFVKEDGFVAINFPPTKTFNRKGGSIQVSCGNIGIPVGIFINFYDT